MKESIRMGTKFDFDAALKQMNAAAASGQFIAMKQRKGQPIFNLADLCGAKSQTAQLLRLFLIERGITRDDLRAKHHERRVADGMPANNISSDYNNIKRNISSQEPTLYYLQGLLYILGYDLTKLQLTVTDRVSGEVTTISTDDVKRILAPDTDKKK